jgi:membrane protein
MGTIVLALVWIYYAALIVFVGALLTAVVDERTKARADTRKRQVRSPGL